MVVLFTLESSLISFRSLIKIKIFNKLVYSNIVLSTAVRLAMLLTEEAIRG